MSDNTSGFTPLVFSACVQKSYSAVPVPANMHTVHKAKQRNTIYNMKLHSYYRQTAQAAEAHEQMSVQVSPLGLVQDQWTRAYIQSSTALIDENQNQPDASGLINLPSLAVWDWDF